MTTRISLVLAYYDNPGMLQLQYRTLAALPAEMREQIELVVVDDGSPHHAAGGPDASELGLPWRVFRIGVDRPWNQDAARNIGGFEACSAYLLLTDMDHLVPQETWDVLLRGCAGDHPWGTKTSYLFSRVNYPDNDPYHPHPNSWFLTRTLFTMTWYDERFSGIYGTDGDFKARLLRNSDDWRTLGTPLQRVPRSVIPDASTTTLVRMRDPQRKKELMERRMAEGNTIKHLTFPYALAMQGR